MNPTAWLIVLVLIVISVILTRYKLRSAFTVKFPSPVEIQSRLVPEGTYKVLHEMKGDQYELVLIKDMRSVRFPVVGEKSKATIDKVRLVLVCDPGGRVRQIEFRVPPDRILKLPVGTPRA